MPDNYGHNIMEGGIVFSRKLSPASKVKKKKSNKQFRIIGKDVIISPEEVFKTFIDLEEDLTMAVDYYLALVGWL